MSVNHRNDFPIVHVYTVCWNEEVMLPHFLRHYAWVNKIVVYDNLSDDGSRDLVESAPNTELRDFDTSGRFEEEALTKLRNQAWKDSRGRADFVVVCDVDELLYHPELAEVLVEMRRRRATLLLPKGYQMVGDQIPEGEADLLRTIPRGVRIHNYDKCILFDPNEIEEIYFSLGAHVCYPAGRAVYFRVPGLTLLHYKYLEFAYVLERNRRYTARTVKSDMARNINAHHRMSVDQLTDRFRTLREQAVDVIALTNEEQNDWRSPPEDLPQKFRHGIRAFCARDHRTAYQQLEQVANWHPDRLRIGAVLSVIARDRKLFWMEAEQILRRSLAIAGANAAPKQTLQRLAKFYSRSNHPEFALNCLQLADRTESGLSGPATLPRRIQKSKLETSRTGTKLAESAHTFDIKLHPGTAKRIESSLQAVRAGRPPPPEKRYRAYCVGLPRSGTHSIDRMLSGCLRSAHEPASPFTIIHILNYLHGFHPAETMRRLILLRDKQENLELESAHYLHHVVKLLVELFPDARFILTVREPRAWLVSEIRQNIVTRNNPLFRQLEAYRYGRFGVNYSDQDRRLEALDNVYPIRNYLLYWQAHIKAVLESVPESRLFVVDTEAISGTTNGLAAFLDVPASEIRLTRAGRGRPDRFSLEDFVEPQFVDESIDRYLTGTLSALARHGTNF